jgi:hypothetical protein
MAQWNKKEWAEIEKLTESAIDTTYYKVYCEFCEANSGEEDYPSSAAEQAYTQGFRIIPVLDRGYKSVACKDCLEKKAWEDDE